MQTEVLKQWCDQADKLFGFHSTCARDVRALCAGLQQNTGGRWFQTTLAGLERDSMMGPTTTPQRAFLKTVVAEVKKNGIPTAMPA